MKGIPDILEFLIHILDTDDKRVKICESPKDIFVLGFYYSKIEKSIINSKIKNKIKLDELLDLIDNDDYYKIYTYLVGVNTYYENMMSKYSF
tara:strand:- start:2486 stop:2761 length:276 start_codon:yes stop_codon:yes gene_type:complete